MQCRQVPGMQFPRLLNAIRMENSGLDQPTDVARDTKDPCGHEDYRIEEMQSDPSRMVLTSSS